MAAFEVEEQESGTYLVYTKEETDTVNSLVLGMLENNKIEGTLPFIQAQVDAQVCYRYDITGLKPVAEYFCGTVSKRMLFAVIEGILAGKTILEEYMLDMGAAVLDSRYIYIRPSTEKICLLLLPVQHEKTSLEQFFRQMVFSVRYNQAENCSYIASLLSYFNGEEPFSAAAFAALIEELKRETVQTGPETAARAEVQPDSTVPLQQPATPKEDARQVMGEGTAVLKQTMDEGTAVLKQTMDEGTAVLKQTAGTGTTVLAQGMYPNAGNTKRKYVNPNLQNIKAGNGAQPSVQAAETAKGKKGLFGRKDKKEAPRKEKRGLFGKKEKKDPAVAQAAGDVAKRPLSFRGIAIPGSDVVDTPADGGETARPSTVPAQEVQIPVHNAPIQDFGSTVDLQAYVQQTSVLGSGQAAGAISPCLTRRTTREQFFISKEMTRIGRSRENTDICITGNTTIGRVHAILYWESGRVYIEDQQSQNGTFVNDRRITGRQELAPGCRIRLSNEEFEFCME